MGFVNLNHQHFQSSNINGTQKLCLKANGDVLVLFVMDPRKSPGCGPAVSSLKSVSQNYFQEGVNVAIVDLTNHKGIIQISRSTNTPITKTPYFLFFRQGRSFASFNGDFSKPANLSNFLKDMVMHRQRLPEQNYNQNTYIPEEIEEPDDDNLIVPEDITPHNRPWLNKTPYRKFGDM